ncbi:MAG: signal peptide peptidase SppA [Pseudomonadota bacterium]
MKRSRTRTALIFLSIIIAAFLIATLLLIVLSDSDKDGSFLGAFSDSGGKIGVVTMTGALTSADDILKELRKHRKKSSIKAVVLRINSPGGAVAPAQEIYREIAATREKKPVIATIETVGASAAYYIASNCTQVVCSKGTITGSIGVIMMLPDIHKVIEKIGVDVTVIKAGKYKDIASQVRPPTQDERAILENFAKEIHEQFIQDVAEGRKGKIELDKLRSIADGSFFSGGRALELGLVDKIGNFFDAVQIAAELGGIKGEPKLVYPEKRWDGLLDMLVGSMAESFSRALDRVRTGQTAPVMY